MKQSNDNCLAKLTPTLPSDDIHPSRLTSKQNGHVFSRISEAKRSTNQREIREMKRIILTVIAAGMVAFGSGCASVATRIAPSLDVSGQAKASKTYPGVMTDLKGIAAPAIHPGSKTFVVWPVLIPLAVFDLPFSFVLDTVFLPIDLGAANDDQPRMRSMQDHMSGKSL